MRKFTYKLVVHLLLLVVLSTSINAMDIEKIIDTDPDRIGELSTQLIMKNILPCLDIQEFVRVTVASRRFNTFRYAPELVATMAQQYQKLVSNTNDGPDHANKLDCFAHFFSWALEWQEQPDCRSQIEMNPVFISSAHLRLQPPSKREFLGWRKTICPTFMVYKLLTDNATDRLPIIYNWYTGDLGLYENSYDSVSHQIKCRLPHSIIVKNHTNQNKYKVHLFGRTCRIKRIHFKSDGKSVLVFDSPEIQHLYIAVDAEGRITKYSYFIEGFGILENDYTKKEKSKISIESGVHSDDENKKKQKFNICATNYYLPTNEDRNTKRKRHSPKSAKIE